MLSLMEPKELIARAREVVGRFSLGGELSAGTVGSALLTKSGNVYTGICIDIYCGIGFCAEHAAIAEMMKHRETEIDMIVAVEKERILPPCGRCREMMYQVNPGNINAKVILAEDRTVTLADLLPERWQEAKEKI